MSDGINTRPVPDSVRAAAMREAARQVDFADAEGLSRIDMLQAVDPGIDRADRDTAVRVLTDAQIGLWRSQPAIWSAISGDVE